MTTLQRHWIPACAGMTNVYIWVQALGLPGMTNVYIWVQALGLPGMTDTKDEIASPRCGSQ